MELMSFFTWLSVMLAFVSQLKHTVRMATGLARLATLYATTNYWSPCPYSNNWWMLLPCCSHKRRYTNLL